MKQVTTQEVLLFLEKEGWTELIDSRWRERLISDIKNEFPTIDNEVLNRVLNLVLV